MKPTSVYPVLMSTDVAAAAAFYRQAFGFKPTFESDWYVSLRTDRWELALLDAGHETIPEPFHDAGASGVLVNFEVEDVDAEYERLRKAGHTFPLTLRSEPFGQRHFIVQGPDSVLVDVITQIEPDPEFAAQFMQD